jgi:hypothetical protein
MSDILNHCCYWVLGSAVDVLNDSSADACHEVEKFPPNNPTSSEI